MSTDPNHVAAAGAAPVESRLDVEHMFPKLNAEQRARLEPVARERRLEDGETLSGVFAVGDVRSGSTKRVATAVGEGSACVQLVHRAIAVM